MSKTFFRRTLAGLSPDDDAASEALRGVQIGQVVAVEISRPRNLQHHRLYWAMVGKIADAVDLPTEAVSDHLKCETGHCHTIKTKDGIRRYPKSISFAAMDQAAFREFFERCCRVISIEWLPHMSPTQIRAEIYEMMGLTWAEAAE
jgi:hypothetical protein